jgi:hypothetical protein
MGSSKGPTTEVIQKPSKSTITQTAFSQPGILSIAGMGNIARDQANLYGQRMFDVANVGRPAGERFTFQPDTIDYADRIKQLPIMSDEYLKEIAEKERIAEAEEKEKGTDREQYLTAINKGDPNIFGIPNYKNTKYYQT